MHQSLNNPTKIIIKGRIPSKKNSRNIFVRGGRPINVPSKQYVIWHKDAMLQMSNYRGVGVVENIERVELFFYAPDKRKYDLTNKAESIMDLLVDFGTIEDDNCEVIKDIRIFSRGVEKENPRCEIDIYRKADEDRLQK